MLQQKRTLFLMIVDECDWAAIHESAHDVYVNDPELMAAPNFVLLQVSATPFNLLTRHSRIPEPVIGYRALAKIDEAGCSKGVGDLLTVEEHHTLTTAVGDKHADKLKPIRNEVPWFESPLGTVCVVSSHCMMASLFRRSALQRVARSF